LASCASDRLPPTLAVRIDGLTVADLPGLSVHDALKRSANQTRSTFGSPEVRSRHGCQGAPTPGHRYGCPGVRHQISFRRRTGGAGRHNRAIGAPTAATRSLASRAPSRRSALGRHLYRRVDVHFPSQPIAWLDRCHRTNRRPACSRCCRRQDTRSRSRPCTRRARRMFTGESLNNRAGCSCPGPAVPRPGHRRSPGRDRLARLGHVLGTAACPSQLPAEPGRTRHHRRQPRVCRSAVFLPAAARSWPSRRSRAGGLADRSLSRPPRSRFTMSELGFCWWQVLGSNQRRLSRRFYRPLAKAL
jgi:hypothetical protein